MIGFSIKPQLEAWVRNTIKAFLKGYPTTECALGVSLSWNEYHQSRALCEAMLEDSFLQTLRANMEMYEKDRGAAEYPSGTCSCHLSERPAPGPDCDVPLKAELAVLIDMGRLMEEHIEAFPGLTSPTSVRSRPDLQRRAVSRADYLSSPSFCITDVSWTAEWTFNLA